MDTHFFIPIAKRDDDQQMVYGYASTPDLDTQDDIVTVEALKRALPEYMKFPTIREMHQPKSVGVTKQAEVKDGKGLYIGAKIVNKEAWDMVKEGAYRAFSIGGRINKRSGKEITDLTLMEISLVDSPANKSAVIELYKADTTASRSELQKAIQNYSTAKNKAEAKRQIIAKANQLNATDLLPETWKVDSIEIPAELAKYMGECCVEPMPVDDPMGAVQRAMMSASSILSTACELCWTRMYFETKGIPTDEIDVAIESLKNLAASLLTDAQYQKFDSIMATVGKAGGMELKHVADFIKVQSGITPLQEVFMVKDEKQLTKAEEAAVEEKDEKVEAPAEEAKPEATEAEPTAEETKEEPKAEEAADDKEAGDNASTMEKLEKMSQELNDVGGADKDEEPATDEEPEDAEKMAKSELMAKMAEQSQALEKMGKTIETLEAALEKSTAVLGQVIDRVRSLESQPAAPKTAHNYSVVENPVAKASGDQPARVKEIQSRMAELTRIKESNLSKFQRDHQEEAYALMDELGKLQS